MYLNKTLCFNLKGQEKRYEILYWWSSHGSTVPWQLDLNGVDGSVLQKKRRNHPWEYSLSDGDDRMRQITKPKKIPWASNKTQKNPWTKN